ncbi:MAG: glycoside hydrolase family 15 protein [Kiloniellales bacterium]
MSSLDLAVIGNCTFGALLDRHARVVWCCLPRFDGDPVFCDLLNDHGSNDPGGSDPDGRLDGRGGFYDVELFELSHSEQAYRRNSAVLVTRLYDRNGGAIEITDFAPRFKQFGRVFRPTMLMRRIKPIAGTPRIRIRLRPAYGYGAHRPDTTRGSNHIRYLMANLVLRLTTDAPLSYIVDEVPFVLEQSITLLLGPDESLHEGVNETARDFFEKTDFYWREWCRYLSLPFEWQEAVIRAAITLKLCSFEESGAVLAAMTTSIPEAPGSSRNWDYRFCWLRDTYFVVHALNRLGATRTMEAYLGYIANIVAMAPDGYLQPLFGITLETKLPEHQADSLAGYRGLGPVRLGNGAHTQIQNDGYGSVILATAQSFFDHRLSHMGDVALFRRLETLGEQAVKRWNQPDAGLWELRTRAAVHTYSAVMCWAGCDRLAKIAAHIGEADRSIFWRRHADELRHEILQRGWNEQVGSFASTFDGDEIDASLLLLPQLGFIEADDPRFLGTLKRIEALLRRGNHIFRYASADDFGLPETAFTVCTFWYIDALVAVGRADEARALFENMLSCRNPLGLLSEDIDPASGELWGNFPQTYSMVGLIHSAMCLSKPWEEAF